MRWPLHIALTLTAVALAVVFATSRKHVVTQAVHDHYARGLRSLAALDAALNDEVLQADKGILRHYDPVVRTLTELRRMPPELRQPPPFLSPSGVEEVRHDLDAFADALHHKEELIEEFKSEAAVLRNSLHYFPIAAEAFETRASDRTQSLSTEKLLRHLLLYNQRPDAELRRAAEADMAEIGKRASGGATDEDLRL